MPAAPDDPLDRGAAKRLAFDPGDHGGCVPGPDGPILRLRRADHV